MTLVHQIYEAVKFSRKYHIPTRWRVSDISKCPRSLYLARSGVLPLEINEPGAGKILRWQAGHHLESSLRPYLKTVYPAMLSNLKFTNEELDLVGEFDGYDPDSKTLISVKCVHYFAMITRDDAVGLKEKVGTKTSARSGKKINDYALKTEPYIHHQWQEHAYKLLLEHPQSYAWHDKEGAIRSKVENRWPVEQIVYVYVTLGGLLTTFTTPPKPEISKRVADKLNYLNTSWRAQQLPLCLCFEGREMYDVQDQYCSYKSESGCCDIKLLETIGQDHSGPTSIFAEGEKIS